MNENTNTVQSIKDAFCDFELIPQNLVRNYYFLAATLMIKNILPKNSVIFKGLKESIDNLDEKSKRYIELRYGLVDGVPMKMNDIGLKYGVSRERARQIIERALINLSGSKIKYDASTRLAYLKAKRRELDEEIEYYTNFSHDDFSSKINIYSFDFSERARNSLEREKILTYEQLMSLTPESIISMKCVGIKTAEEIWFKLHGVPFPLKKIHIYYK